MFRVYYFFFFKQKTAYEMRISDWSSDVCSSDLIVAAATDCYGQIPRHSQRYGRYHVIHALAARNKRRAPVDHGVPDPSCRVEPRVAGSKHLSAKIFWDWCKGRSQTVHFKTPLPRCEEAMTASAIGAVAIWSCTGHIGQ